MKITHNLSNADRSRRGFRVLVIGAGGNGSAVLFGLPYLHHALIAWGFADGLNVTVMDADTVSPTNCVRQPFGAADIGQNKATILINRINLFHQLSWHSDETFFSQGSEHFHLTPEQYGKLQVRGEALRAPGTAYLAIQRPGLSFNLPLTD